MKRGRTLALLAIGHGAEHWYIGILGPVLPFLIQDMDISLTQVGILFAGRSLFSALSSVGTGFAIDALGGGKWVLVACLSGIAAFYVGMSLATSFLTILPIFWLSGVITHLWHPPSMGLLGEKFSDRKGFALGVHGTGANISQALSPIFAGFLLLFLHWRGVLLLNTIPLLIMAFILWYWLPPFHPGGSGGKNTGNWIRNVREAFFQNPAFGTIAMISGAITSSHHGLIAFLPLLLVTKYKMGPEWVGLCLGVYSTASILPETAVGFLSDRVSRKRILMIGAACGGIAMLAIPAMAPGALILIPVTIVAIFLRSLRPVIFAHALEVSPPGLGGSTVGLIYTTNQTFSAIGPLAAGILSDLYGIDSAFWLFGSITLLTLPFFAMIPYPPLGRDNRPASGTDSKPSPYSP